MPTNRRKDSAAENLAYGPIDGMLLGAILLLLVGGLIMVLSASIHTATMDQGIGNFYFMRNGLFAIIGVVVMLTVSKIPYALYQRYVALILLTALALMTLVLVPALGHTAGRATRWFNIFGLFMFQPTEFAKIAFVIYLAHVTSAKAKSLHSLWKGYLPPLLVAGVLMGLALAEPDFGTAVIFGVLVVTLLFVAGTKLAYVAFTFAFLVPSAVYMVYHNTMRLNRVMAFLDPWAHRYDTAYATVNSLAAMATGGLTGVGLGRGQQKIGYIPEAQTDFILSVVGEELGLIGTMVLVALYVVVILRGLRAAKFAPDSFGQTLGFGLVFLLTIQVFINVGVAYALLPTKGLTLPLVSYGGTSMLMTCISMGILLQISRCQGERRTSSTRHDAKDNPGAVPLKLSGDSL